MKKLAELVFVPLPNMGHIVSILEFAKLVVDRDDRFSITVLIMNLPPQFQHSAVDTHIRSLSAWGRIRFVHLPQPDNHPPTSSSRTIFDATHVLCSLIEDQKPLVRNAVKQLVATHSESTQLAGFVLDMLTTSMVDVAHEFGVPSYVFFTASVAFLGLMFHLQTLQDQHGIDVTELVDSDAELVVPGFVNPVPSRVLPPVLGESEGGGSAAFLRCLSRFRETKGIVVNSFMELESAAVNSFHNGTSHPDLYPVGPLLNLKHEDDDCIMKWLDGQPQSSVVFLCFGSNGYFSLEQVKEIAEAVERSQCRFLWSLRRPPPPPKDEMALLMPTDYTTDLGEVLPQGFLDRTAGIGKVIGWAPQPAVLAHPSVGGFVSHCGWNSTLESLWYGVPIATWPIYSEQQLNAFQLVKELGLGVEITLDYKYNNAKLVRAEEIENGIRNLMRSTDHSGQATIKTRANEVKECIRNTLIDGGSSHSSLARLLKDIIANIT